MIWLALLLCLLVSFLFSGIEAGLLSLNRVRLRHRMKLGDAAARKLSKLSAHPDRLLVTVLLVTNFANICAVALVTRLCMQAWGKYGYGLALLFVLPFYLLGLEMLPKSLFRRFPYRALAAFSEPLRLADLLLSPLLALGGRLLRLMPRRQAEKKLFVAREDFKYLTIESERHGALGPVERAMIHGVVDFRAVRVRDVMAQWEKTCAIPATATVAELLEICRRTQLDQMPVVSGKNEIIGLVNTFDVLLDAAPRTSLRAYTRRILTVRPDEEAGVLLRRLRGARVTLATVVSETGELLGVASLGDLTSRLVKTSMGGKKTEK